MLIKLRKKKYKIFLIYGKNINLHGLIPLIQLRYLIGRIILYTRCLNSPEVAKPQSQSIRSKSIFEY